MMLEIFSIQVQCWSLLKTIVLIAVTLIYDSWNMTHILRHSSSVWWLNIYLITVTNKCIWLSQKWELFISMDKRTSCTLLARFLARNFCQNFTVNYEPVQLFGPVRSTMVIRLITSKSHDFRLYSWCHLWDVDQGRQNFILIRNIDRSIYDSVQHCLQHYYCMFNDSLGRIQTFCLWNQNLNFGKIN